MKPGCSPETQYLQQKLEWQVFSC